MKIIVFMENLKWGEAQGLLCATRVRTVKRINNWQYMAKEKYSQETVSTKNSSQSNSLFVAINTDSKHLWKDARFFWFSVLPQTTQGSQSWYKICSISEYGKHRCIKVVKDTERYDSHSHSAHLQNVTCSSGRKTTDTQTHACSNRGC